MVDAPIQIPNQANSGGRQMAKQRLRGKLVPKGYLVIESSKAELSIPTSLQAAFQKNPEKVLAQYLKSQGQVVNGVRIARKPASGTSVRMRRRFSGHWYHIISPASERSWWLLVER
jgi:hypothetical protein